MNAPEPAWREAFKGCMTRVSFELKLTRAMLEMLCALSDEVAWDRRAYGGLHYPDNFMATNHALTRRGLIERREPQKVRDGMPPPWKLTPAGVAAIEMLRVGGLFIEAEAARTKLSKRRGRW